MPRLENSAFVGSSASLATKKGVVTTNLGLLDAIALTTEGAIIVGSASGPVAETGATLLNSLNLGASNSVSFGSLSLTTPLPVASGGTGGNTAATGRNGLELGLTDSPTFQGLTLNDADPAGNQVLFKIQDNASNLFTVDAEGDIVTAGELSVGGNKVFIGSSVSGADLNNSGVVVGGNSLLWSHSGNYWYFNRSVSITGNLTVSGSLSLPSALPITSGGTGGVTATAARDSLGLEIGSDVQAYNARLYDISLLTPTSNGFIAGDGNNFVIKSGSALIAGIGLGDLSALDTVNNTNWSGTALAVTNGGTGSTTAADARTALGVDVPVTLAGSGNYLTLSNQEITVGEVDISDDTNLVVGTPLVLTGDTLSIPSSSTSASGFMSSASFTKLDGIEANADVTNATNVAAAGAVMTEVNDLSSAVTWVDVPTGNITQDSVTQHVGAIDHDSLSNFVANEHIDWTADQGSTNIHTGNYTNTTYTSSDFTHDDLTGFVSNEHIDWTVSSQGTIHSTNIPAIALTTVQTAANQTAHLALTAEEGDVVVRSDENKSYVHNGGSAGDMTDYTLLATPTDAVLSVDGATGAVALTHDGLSGFVANEHIDWTIDQGSTDIHANNYTNTTYTSSDFTHDDLTGFVASEHIDWTADGAGTIHTSNYVDNDTTYSVGNSGLVPSEGTSGHYLAHDGSFAQVAYSQVSGTPSLSSYITASSTDTLTNKSGLISQWTDDVGYLTSANSGNWSASSGDVYRSTGNVGIGTVPSKKFHVDTGEGELTFHNDAAGSNANLRIWRNDTSIASGNPIGYLSFAGSDASAAPTDHATIYAEAAGDHNTSDNPTSLKFQTTDDGSGTPVDRMTIYYDGKVGIGNMAPHDKLTIGGGTGDGDTYNSVIRFDRTSSTGNVLASKIVFDDQDTNWGDLKFKMKTTASASENNSFWTDALTLEGRYGNVGLRTSTPKANLHYKAAGNSWEDSFLMEHSTGDTGWNIHAENNTDKGLWIAYNSDTSVAYTSQNASVKMVLDKDGNVGIGEPSPSGILHTKSDDLGLVLQTSATANKRMQVFFQDSGGTQTGRFGNDISGEDAAQMQWVAGSGSSPQMTLTSDGELGIGTTDPNALLQVAGRVTAGYDVDHHGRVTIGSGAASDELLSLSVQGGGGSTQGIGYIGFRQWPGKTHPSVRLDFEEYDTGDHMGTFGISVNKSNADVAPTRALTVKGSGSVGIVTTDPQNLLHVRQIGTSSNSYYEGAIQAGGSSSTLGGVFGYSALGSGRVNISSLNNDGGENATIKLGFGAITSGEPANTVMTLNQSGNQIHHSNRILDSQTVGDLQGGASYRFDGANDYVEATTTSAVLLGDSPFSISFWAKSGSSPAHVDRIIEMGNSGGNFITICWATDNRVFYQAYNGSWDTALYTSNNSISNSEFKHFTLVKDGTGTTWYVNGVADTTQSTGSASDINDVAGKLRFGAALNGANTWPGDLRQVRIHNRALTAADVAVAYNGQAVPFEYTGASQTNLISATLDQTFSTDVANSTAFESTYVWGETSGADVEVSSNEITVDASGYRDGIWYPASLKAGKRYRVTFDATTVTGDWEILVAVSGTYHIMADVATGVQSYEFTTPSGLDGNLIIAANWSTWDATLVIDASSTNFTVVQIGCVSEYLPQSIGDTKWLDTSGNSLHGTVSGAVQTNNPAIFSAKVGIGTTTPYESLHIEGGALGISYSSSGYRVTHHQNAVNQYTIGNGYAQLRMDHDGTVIVNSGGQVGIRTTAPKANLHLKAAGNSWEDSLLLEHSTGDTGWSIHAENNTDKGLWIGYNSDTSVSTTNQTASVKMVLDKDGNVGIGTDTPSEAHSGADNLVVGGGSGDTGITIFSGNTSLSRLHFSDALSGAAQYAGWIAYTHNTNKLQFATNSSGSANVTIDSNGNVGIGTAAPTSKLALGTTGVTSGGLSIKSTAADAYGIVVVASANDKWLRMGHDGTKGVIETTYESTGGFSDLYVRAGETNDLILQDDGGNVGIGTDDPGAKLDVQNSGAGDGTFLFSVRGSNSGRQLQMTNLLVGSDNDRVGIYWENQGVANTRMWMGDDGYLRDKISNPTSANDGRRYIREDDDGNVGIGTTSPDTLLESDVDSASTGTDSITARNKGVTTVGHTVGFKYQFNSAVPAASRAILTNASSGVGRLGFFVSTDATAGNLTEYLSITSAGHVGIGKTDPTGALYVKGEDNTRSRITVENTAGSSVFSLQPQYNDNRLDVLSSSTTVISMKGTGNVGIGTITPEAKLTIDGSVRNWSLTNPGTTVGTIHLNPGYHADDLDDQGGSITWGAVDDSAGNNSADNAQAGIYVKSAGGYGTHMALATTNSYANGAYTRMFIHANGNIGIGTTAPASKLTVSSGSSTANSEISVGYDQNNRGIITYLPADDRLGFGTIDGGTNYFDVLSIYQGKVGIGTTAPTAPLTVVADANAEAIRVFGRPDGHSSIELRNNDGTTRYGGLDAGSSSVTLYTDDSNPFHINTGGNTKFIVENDGDVLPGTDNTQDLGSSSKRWANLHVGDVQLNNQGSGGNEIDGTEGKWTIQEGEDELFIINRKNGKKYKFKLEEVE